MNEVFTVLWDEMAVEDLQQLPKQVARRIQEKVTQHLAQAPGQLGKPLRGRLSGYYRYRIGDYRVIYELRQREIAIIVVKVGNRKNIYED